jgi:four helix bundle protein
MKNNVIVEKSYLFSLRIIKLHLFLTKELKQFKLADQVLSSGTSIGANAEEAVGGISRKDFVAKFSISYKEARETKYWLRLLRDAQLIDGKLAESLLNDCEELLKILYSIINTTRK